MFADLGLTQGERETLLRLLWGEGSPSPEDQKIPNGVMQGLISKGLLVGQSDGSLQSYLTEFGKTVATAIRDEQPQPLLI